MQKTSTDTAVTDTSEIDINLPETTNNADYVYLSNSTTIGTAAGRVNVAQYGSFDIRPTAVASWTDADINSALKVIIALHYTPTAGVLYKITYHAYNGVSVSITKSFHVSGGVLVLIP